MHRDSLPRCLRAAIAAVKEAPTARFLQILKTPSANVSIQGAGAQSSSNAGKSSGSAASSSSGQAAGAATSSSWDVLDDNYLMAPKLKDWDKIEADDSD